MSQGGPTPARQGTQDLGTEHEPGELDTLVPELRHGLAGAWSAIRVVRNRAADATDRVVLDAALAHLERMDRQLRQLACQAETCSGRSGVREAVHPPVERGQAERSQKR